MHPYDHTFFDKRRQGVLDSARIIVPMVLECVRPKRVIDVGCGEGTWLSIFRQQGVAEVRGIDGSYVDPARLEIPAECFCSCDLRRPIELHERFDLVVSMEVAEHLPSTCADTFVRSLTVLGPVVLFSAAIPHQGGTNHLNEQWPHYWIERFEAAGFITIDCLRRRLWGEEAVAWWYAQNLFLFVKREDLDAYPQLKRERAAPGSWPAALVHPKGYLRWIEECAAQKMLARRMHHAAQELAALVPSGQTMVLVDESQFEPWAVPAGRRTLPFLERNGQYNGPPPDDATAISELRRMQLAGAHFLAFGWPAFWWLQHYRQFHDFLRNQMRCLLENERLIVFDLRDPSTSKHG